MITRYIRTFYKISVLQRKHNVITINGPIMIHKPVTPGLK